MDNEKKQVTYNSSITGETQVTFDIQQGSTQHSTSDWSKTGGDNAYPSYPVTCGAYAIQCAGIK